MLPCAQREAAAGEHGPDAEAAAGGRGPVAEARGACGTLPDWGRAMNAPPLARSTASLLTGLLATLAMSACGGSETGESSGTTSAGGGSSTSSSTGTDAGGGGDGTGGLGGAGGQTSSGGGGTGDLGGGGTGGLGGSGGGTGGLGDVILGGDGHAACVAMCTAGTCEGNLCTEGPRMGVGLQAVRSQFLDQAPAEQGIASASSLGTAVVEVDLLATAGACWWVDMTVLQGDFNPLPFDAGAITLDGPTTGSFPLPQVMGGYQGVSLPFDAAFTAGDVVTATGTGGATHPAFSLATIAPEDLTVSLSPLDDALPFTITWSPAPPPSWIMLSSANNTIFCVPDAPGSLTIPAGLMSLFLATAEHVSVNVVRASMVKTDFGGAGPTIYWSVGRADSKVLLHMP